MSCGCWSCKRLYFQKRIQGLLRQVKQSGGLSCTLQSACQISKIQRLPPKKCQRIEGVESGAKACSHTKILRRCSVREPSKEDLDYVLTQLDMLRPQRHLDADVQECTAGLWGLRPAAGSGITQVLSSVPELLRRCQGKDAIVVQKCVERPRLLRGHR